MLGTEYYTRLVYYTSATNRGLLGLEEGGGDQKLSFGRGVFPPLHRYDEKLLACLLACLPASCSSPRPPGRHNKEERQKRGKKGRRDAT